MNANGIGLSVRVGSEHKVSTYYKSLLETQFSKFTHQPPDAKPVLGVRTFVL